MSTALVIKCNAHRSNIVINSISTLLNLYIQRYLTMKQNFKAGLESSVLALSSNKDNTIKKQGFSLKYPGAQANTIHAKHTVDKINNENQNTRAAAMNNIRFNETAYQRFIPIHEDDLIANLIPYADWSDEKSTQFQQICHIFVNLYHVRSHKSLQKLKRAYRPFNPDADTIELHSFGPDERNHLLKELINELSLVLDRANFETLQPTELNQALSEKSPYGVEVSVDFDEFEEIAVFYRGSALQTTTQRPWQQLFLRKKTTEIPIFRRLFLLLKLKATEQDNQNDAVYLKLFKNIPASDLEMLFPNTRVKMTVFDKLKLSMTGGGGAIGGVLATLSKITAATNPYTIIIAIGGFGAVMWRQIANIFNPRAKYMATLASLDQTIESYLTTEYGLHVDFEIEDSIGKLKKSGLIEVHPNGELSAISFTDALQKLNAEWDSLLDEFNPLPENPVSV